MLKVTVAVLLSVIIVSLVSLIGIFTFFIRAQTKNKTLLFLVSLSAGTLFGGAFLHLLPEIVGTYGFTLNISLLVLSGIIIFFIMERIIHWHHCHVHHDDKAHLLHIKEHAPKHIAPLSLIGDGLHNFVDGLVIAGSYLISIPTGVATTIAVVVHEVPQEIADFGLLLYAGLTKKKALLFNFLSALTAVIGAIAGLLLSSYSEWFAYFILPFAAGGFIYIAGANLIPELHKNCDVKDSIVHLLAMLLGIGIMVALLYLS